MYRGMYLPGIPIYTRYNSGYNGAHILVWARAKNKIH